MYGARVRVDGMAKVAEIEEAEREKMRKKCHKITEHGINVFVNRQLIYNFPEQVGAWDVCKPWPKRPLLNPVAPNDLADICGGRCNGN
jgi:hypothetical protein